MKYYVPFLLILFFSSCYFSSAPKVLEDNKLFPVVEQGRWGYINSEGGLVIPCKYWSAGAFSEGLAPVRQDGLYGYIDVSGKFVIEPQYDAAYAFDSMKGMVSIEGKPYCINREGTILFDHDFKSLDYSGVDDLFSVRGNLGKWGLLDMEGKLVADTIFSNIRNFVEERAIIRKNDSIREVGVIDKQGKWIVPFGKYDDIDDFQDGFAKVTFDVAYKDDTKDWEGMIDKDGVLQFSIPRDKWKTDYWKGLNYSEGLASITIYQDSEDEIKEERYRKRSDYAGLVDRQGNVVLSNKAWLEIAPFEDGRAFVQDTASNYYLIDKEGNILNKENPCVEILGIKKDRDKQYFYDGKAVVKTQKGWRVMDRSGNFLTKPKKKISGPSRINNIVYWNQGLVRVDDEMIEKYGFWDIETDFITNPEFDELKVIESSENLIYVVGNGQMRCVTNTGRYVWKAQNGNGKIKPFNIDYMRYSNYHAASPMKGKGGGWAISDNMFKKNKKKMLFEKDSLSLSIRVGDDITYRKKYKGNTLYLANTTKDSCFLSAQDSGLYITLEAKDKCGEWKDIEYIMHSWCGNSYHTLFLPPNHHWEFTIPIFDGAFKTKLRAKLFLKKDGDYITTYSEEFDGSINPGQFSVKRPYYPSGLMDPYN